MTSKSWRIMEEEGGRFEFRRNEALTADNKHRELEWIENGSNWRADRCLNFYCMLPKDIENEKEAVAMLAEGKTPDKVNVLTPCMLQFTRTSYNSGKRLITHFAMARQLRKPPAAWYFKLGAKMQENDKGKFGVFNIEDGGLTNQDHLAKCREWYEIIKSSEVRNHEADTAEETEQPTPASEPSDKF
jgi:hypothetical protein